MNIKSNPIKPYALYLIPKANTRLSYLKLLWTMWSTNPICRRFLANSMIFLERNCCRCFSWISTVSYWYSTDGVENYIDSVGQSAKSGVEITLYAQCLFFCAVFFFLLSEWTKYTYTPRISRLVFMKMLRRAYKHSGQTALGKWPAGPAGRIGENRSQIKKKHSHRVPPFIVFIDNNKNKQRNENLKTKKNIIVCFIYSRLKVAS